MKDMEERRLGFWARLWMWIWLPWKVLFSPAAAWKVARALQGPELEAPEKREAEPPLPIKAEPEPPPPAHGFEDGALYMLSILQRDGRLVDFLQEEIAAASDGDVGAAARIVHEGCRKVLGQYVTLAPIRSEEEGSAIDVQEGFDPATLRLTGNVVGQPPFRGRLAHPGWKAAKVGIPTLGKEQDPTIIAPAEVEL